MNIVLKFDYYSRTIYIPDGYIFDVKKMQVQFFEWLYDQPDCFIQDKNGNLSVSYNEDSVVKYINNVILCDSKEKAYYISNMHKINGRIYTLEF